ncbi:MAG: hypothetical protein Q9160_008448 [Pyrenula sp. 1 TL-2023]
MSSPNNQRTLPTSIQNGVIPRETDALLPKSSEASVSQRIRDHMTRDVRKHRADLVLLLSYIITGLLDSSAVFIWGSFVSMQTGNTVYLGLGVVAPHESTRWLRSLISITFFCLGSLLFAFFHRTFSPRRRWVLVSSFSAQLALIIAAAVIVTTQPNPVAGNDKVLEWHVAVPLALVAFQSSGQAVTSRALGFNSLTSVVLTSIYCDLFSDPYLLKGFNENAERNRRAAAPALLLVGAILGGVWAHSEVGLAGALWTAVGIKAVIVVIWVVWWSEGEGGA